MKNVSLVLCAVVMACVAPTMATTEIDWAGFTNDWDNLGNWDGDPTPSTTRVSIDPIDATLLGGGNMPLIDSTTNTSWGLCRLRREAVVTQTGGSVTWQNGTGWDTSFYMYRDAEWNISGGTMQINGMMYLGYNKLLTKPDIEGEEYINISGTGEVRLVEMTWGESGAYDYALAINDAGSGITIADDGALIVQSQLEMTVDDYITAGKIVGVGGALAKTTLAETHLGQTLISYSVVPEPATMALLGLGALALRRKK